jgi:hypothetical protein
MAETTSTKTRRHITNAVISDGGAISYDIPLRGDLSYTPGGYALIDFKDYDGSFTGNSPTRGEENATTGTIEATVRGLSARLLADMGLKDFLDHSGVVATATTTGIESGSVVGEVETTYTLTVTTTDHTKTETMVFPRTTFVEGSSLSAGLEGTKINLSFTSRQAFPTVT